MKRLEPEDLIKFGLIPEFIGRMPIIATLNDLDEASLITILQEPKNSLIKQYKRLFEFENVELEFKEDALIEIAKKAISKKTGARVTIDKSAAKSLTDPIVTYGKKQSTSVA